MELDEYAQVMSTRLGLQALLTVMMHSAETAAVAVAAKEMALKFATETDRTLPDRAILQAHSEAVHEAIGDLFGR